MKNRRERWSSVLQVGRGDKTSAQEKELGVAKSQGGGESTRPVHRALGDPAVGASETSSDSSNSQGNQANPLRVRMGEAQREFLKERYRYGATVQGRKGVRAGGRRNVITEQHVGPLKVWVVVNLEGNQSAL